MRHIAGATVSHRSPFENIETPSSSLGSVTKDIIDKWVIPFYMKHPSEDEYTNQLSQMLPEVTHDLVDTLLADFNWRTRSVGAILAASIGYREAIDVIGKHLLKSEICYAGKSYAVSLAAMEGDDSVNYLCEYLDYYLDRKDLYYDQSEVYSALRYLDEDVTSYYKDKWIGFVSDKEYWDIDRTYEWVSRDIEAVKSLLENK